MKLEQKEKSLLFSETMLPDIFFSEYLTALPGEYLKIYLYLVRSFSHKNFTIRIFQKN